MNDGEWAALGAILSQPTPLSNSSLHFKTIFFASFSSRWSKTFVVTFSQIFRIKMTK